MKLSGTTKTFWLTKKLYFTLKSWFRGDIVQLQDLLNINREFPSLADFKQKFNIDTPFTLYHGLINAILNEWKRSIRNLNRPIQSASLETSMPTTYSYKNMHTKISWIKLLYHQQMEIKF